MISLIGKLKNKINRKEEHVNNSVEENYFNSLGLLKDPFSTSPDPNYFYPCKQHQSCLTYLEISIRMQRGACLVLGEIGTGKTTVCRTLVNNLNSDNTIKTHLILNPSFSSELDLLLTIAKIFNLKIKDENEEGVSSLIREYLLKEAYEKGYKVVLIIDEAQKLSIEAIECLRMLLNFETNEIKLLQLILLGQLELNEKLDKMPNFVDRVNYISELKPLSKDESFEIINYRFLKAGYNENTSLFSDGAKEAIYELSKGYPRKLCMISHEILNQMIINNRKQADISFVQSLFLKEFN